MQILWCLVVLIGAIPFCLVLQTLTSPIFNEFRIDWPMLWQSHHHLLTLLHSLRWLPVKFTDDFKIRLLIYRTPWKISCLSSLHACHITSIQVMEIKQRNHSVVPFGSRPTQAQRGFHSCAPSFWNNFPLSVCSATSTKIFRNMCQKRISLTWPFPHRHQPARADSLLVMIMELLYRFCCWTPIQLSNLAMLETLALQTLIDWLIDWLIDGWRSSLLILCCATN